MLITTTEKIKFVQSIFGTCHTDGKQANVWCPYCRPSDKEKRKLSIRLDDFCFHCWTCPARGRSLWNLIKQFGTREQLLYYRDRFLPKTDIVKRKFLDEIDIINKPELPTDFTLLPLANKQDPDVKAAWNYVTKRGLTSNDVWKHKLGISNDYRWYRRIIVPSFDSTGDLNFFIGRAIDGTRKPKYDNADVDKNKIIFNEINIDWTSRLVLCEGVFDAFNCGDNAIPILGSTLNLQSSIFNAIVANNTPVALALDADMTTKTVPLIFKSLSEYGIDVVVVDLKQKSDPGAMTKSEFKKCLNVAKPLTWFDMFENKINKASRSRLTL